MKSMMKWCLGGLLLVSMGAWADDAALLKRKLSTLKAFSAQFTQNVYDIEGKKLQQASGLLSLSRPDRFRWETRQPDESLILSDGKSVWMYDPFVEQVTVLKLSDAVINTPFLLISSTDESLWRNYEVLREANTFTVTSRNRNERIESLRLVFDNKNRISRFEVNEAQGQRSEFQLSQFNLRPALKPDTFVFKVPKGVVVDDQR